MRITRATHRGRRGYNILDNQGYGTSRETQIDNLYGRDMEPDAFLALEEGRHKPKRRITLAKVSILDTNEDDNVRKKEMEKKKKGTASWHEEAIRRRAAGEGPSQIAKDFGVSPSRVSQVTATGDALERYKAQAAKSLARLAAKDKDKKEAKEAKEKDPMADRTFEPFKPVNPADLRPGVKIVCSSCGKTKVFRKHGTIHPVHAANVFRNEGWAVGAGPRADKCPDCVSGLGHAKPKPEAKPEPVKDLKELAAAIVAKEKHEEAVPAVEIPQPIKLDPPVTPPSEMTKADRRVINAKLEDVYLDETTGYKGEWTDEKVAVDLGVSVLWVSELREQNFGPAKNVAVLARQMEELLTFGAKIAATAKGIQSAVDEIDGRIKEYDVLVEKFDGDFARFNELYAELKK